jgi:hypothetical protein
MVKQITIKYSPMGDVSAEVEGYQGGECHERIQPDTLGEKLGGEFEVQDTEAAFNEPDKEEIPEDYGTE